MHLALVLGLLGLALLPAAAGNHLQTGDSRTVAFDHKTGNEWWVEVIMSGPSAGTITRVEAMDDGGPWVTLEKRSWGAWARSFHIEPGHDVRFRATWGDGDRVVSCWFAHPGGVEKCADNAWHMTPIARASGNDIVVGDADGDGDQEV